MRNRKKQVSGPRARRSHPHFQHEPPVPCQVGGVHPGRHLHLPGHGIRPRRRVLRLSQNRRQTQTHGCSVCHYNNQSDSYFYDYYDC